VVKRGQSVVYGEQVIVNTKDERARVLKPRGTIVPEEKQDVQPVVAVAGALPAVCPIVKRTR
jgi:hypothetical protein